MATAVSHVHCVAFQQARWSHSPRFSVGVCILIIFSDVHFFPCVSCLHGNFQVQRAVSFLRHNNITFGRFWLDILGGATYWTTSHTDNIDFFAEVLQVRRRHSEPPPCNNNNNNNTPTVCHTPTFSQFKSRVLVATSTWWLHAEATAALAVVAVVFDKSAKVVCWLLHVCPHPVFLSTRWLHGAAQGVAETGINAGIYTRAEEWLPIFGDYTGGSKLPLWYASNSGGANFSDFEPFAGWTVPVMKVRCTLYM